MKRFFPVALIIMLGTIALTIFSCSKSVIDPVGIYTCTCSYSSLVTGSVVNQAQFTTASIPQSSAMSQCDAQAAKLTKNGATVVSCHL